MKKDQPAEPASERDASSPVTALAAHPTSQPASPSHATLDAARRGERAARDAVVRLYVDDVYKAVARILVGRPAAWDDVAQDAMLNVLRGLGDFEPSGAATLRTWILTITARTAIDALRRRSRYEARLAAVATVPTLASPTPEVIAEQHELAQRVAAAMEALPTDQRVALVLRAYHDQDYAEIAVATGSSVASVKSRLNRARVALARLLGRTPMEVADER